MQLKKSARVVVTDIAVEVQPREPIFEKCPHLREKGGKLTLITTVGFVLTYTVPLDLGKFTRLLDPCGLLVPGCTLEYRYGRTVY
jgi:hypothetical protein